MTSDGQTLDPYLTASRKLIPRTTKVFARLENAAERKALIEYLKDQH